MSDLRVIDENGQVLTTINSGDRILRKESVDHLSETIPWGKDMDFVKMYSHFSKVALGLSGGATVIAVVLAEYIAYQSNLICNRCQTNPLNNDDICRITGYEKRQVLRLMTELVEKKVFARTKVGHSYQYYANPYIYSKGARINKTLEAMFRNYTLE